MSRRISLIGVVAVVACLVAGSAFGAVKLGQVTVKEGDLTGKVVDNLGKPVADTRVEVLGKADKVLAAAVSDKAGSYRIKDLASGEYRLRVGKRYTIRLFVAGRARVSDLKLVLPQGYAAADLALPTTALGWGIIAAGAGAVTWVTLETMHNNEWILKKGGHGVCVSP